MNLKQILDAYQRGERGMPTYAELRAIDAGIPAHVKQSLPTESIQEPKIKMAPGHWYKQEGSKVIIGCGNPPEGAKPYEPTITFTNGADVAALPTAPASSMEPDEYMCPNCVTPWKCNGLHIPQEEFSQTSGREAFEVWFKTSSVAYWVAHDSAFSIWQASRASLSTHQWVNPVAVQYQRAMKSAHSELSWVRCTKAEYENAKNNPAFEIRALGLITTPVEVPDDLIVDIDSSIATVSGDGSCFIHVESLRAFRRIIAALIREPNVEFTGTAAALSPQGPRGPQG